MTSELEVARRLLCSREMRNEFLDWLSAQSSIVWTPDAQEPDTIKAIVFNQILSDDHEFQTAALLLLLQNVREMSVDRVKALHKRYSVPTLLQKCIDRFNVLNSEICINLLLCESEYPKLEIIRKITINGTNLPEEKV